MILYEFEGKKLLAEAGILVPKSELITDSGLASLARMTLKAPLVLKAQVLSGKRADAGGIIVVEQKSNIKNQISKLLGKKINKETVEKVLIEEKVEFDKEYYLSLSYDTEVRGPVLTISQSGGTGIEERGAKTYPIDILKPNEILNQVQDDMGVDKELLIKLVDLFFAQDLLLLEINPLVKTKPFSVIPAEAGIQRKELLMDPPVKLEDDNSAWVALDAKIKLDDTALGRHKEDPSTSSGQGWNYPPRAVPGHTRTEREIEAKKIDEGDYRGTAGSTYFDLEGDIAILASGGGASITAMDALIKMGGRPANYTEYSGNPPKEKVEKLTKIVLSKPNLNGLWIVGALANFTDIYETLSGFIDGLRYTEKELGRKIDFPIVIRRAGPNDKKAFEMLKEQTKDYDLHLFGEETSITQSAEVIVEKAKEYASKIKN